MTDALSAGTDVLLDIDVQGAATIRKNDDPLVRKAIDLQSYEETRHGRLLKYMLGHYGIEIEQVPMKEIAAAMACPLPTAYARLHAARQHIDAAARRHAAREGVR